MLTNESVGDETEVLRVETSLVTIPVSVFDREGRYIPALKQEDFKIFENGEEQEVSYFGTSEKPFTIILMLDVSPSTQYKIEEIHAAATAFVNQLKPQDSVTVIEFDRYFHVLTEPTTDRAKIAKAIRKADFGEGTSLYDAVKNTISKQLSRIEGRKAIVLFTDGVDTTSTKAGYSDTLRDAEEADAMVFPVYYDTYTDSESDSGGVMSSPLPQILNLPFPGGGRGGNSPRRPSRRDYERGKEYLDELANRTGGRMFDTKTESGGLTGAFAAIAEDLRRQYSIGYYPQEVGQIGDRKAIKVRVTRSNLVVRARDSYIVGANDAQQPATADSPRKFSLNRQLSGGR